MAKSLFANSSTIVWTGRCYAKACVLAAGTTVSATATVYDALSVSGNPIARLQALVDTTDRQFYGGEQPGEGLRCDTGVYVSLAGQGAQFFLYQE